MTNFAVFPKTSTVNLFPSFPSVLHTCRGLIYGSLPGKVGLLFATGRDTEHVWGA